MRYRLLDRRALRAAYDSELSAYRDQLADGDRAAAWAHLERAHILSQRYLTRHWRTHWLMLGMAREDGRRGEVRGQIRRLAAVPLGWLGGWVPRGNTGGADVHPLKPMAVQGDLAEALRGYSPWKDVAVRVVLVGVVVLAVLWARAAWAEVRDRNGENLVVTASAAGSCALLPSLPGAEDIVLDAEAGIGLAIGGDRRAFRDGGAGRSRVFAFALDDPGLARDVSPGQPAELKGFGADLLRGANGRLWLGIANRAGPAHSVEVYAVGDDGSLDHHATLSAPGFTNPNDLVLLSPDAALVTLDKRARAGSVWEIVEGARRAPTGRVVRLRAGRMDVVAEGLLSANGIAVLDDGRVAVGELVGRAVSVFAPGAEAPGAALTLERRVLLPFAVDNLTSPDGTTLLAAGHPKLLTLARGYQRSEAAKSPSMAVRLDPETGERRVVFEDSGDVLSASSVATALPDGRLMIGTAFGPAAALCDPAT